MAWKAALLTSSEVSEAQWPIFRHQAESLVLRVGGVGAHGDDVISGQRAPRESTAMRRKGACVWARHCESSVAKSVTNCSMRHVGRAVRNCRAAAVTSGSVLAKSLAIPWHTVSQSSVVRCVTRMASYASCLATELAVFQSAGSRRGSSDS